MKWDAPFSPIKSMTEAEAKAFMDANATGSYQLVDVETHTNMKNIISRGQHWFH